MIRINQDERLSIWIEIFPKTTLFPMKISILFPVNALTAGVEVVTATRTIKIKFAFALVECGSKEIEITPAISNDMARASNKDSVIGIYLFWC